MENKITDNKKLSLAEIEKIEDTVADRLAEILIMQLDHEKLKKTEKNKEKAKS